MMHQNRLVSLLFIDHKIAFLYINVIISVLDINFGQSWGEYIYIYIRNIAGMKNVAFLLHKIILKFNIL